MTLVACFVFVHVTDSISFHRDWLERCELCRVKMIGDIDLVFGLMECDTWQSFGDYCLPAGAYF